jgi:hypothetical protein
MKKGQTAGVPTWIVALVFVVALILLGLYIFNKYYKESSRIGFDPALYASKVKSCEVQSKMKMNEGTIFDMDGDGLMDSCDPCIDGPDKPEFDLNGDGISDYCQYEDGKPIGYVSVYENIDKSRFCRGEGSEYWDTSAYDDAGRSDMLKCEPISIKDSVQKMIKE